MVETRGEGTLPLKLLERIIKRLGLPVPPSPDLAGLRKTYGAWCASVPFDNVRKVIALRSGETVPLPGGDAVDFFEHWLAHGAGGTCWPSSNALFALMHSLGFQARRIAGSMRDLGILNHASVKVTLDGCHWLVDSSMLTVDPLPLGARVFILNDALVPAEVEPSDGTHVLWFQTPANAEFLPCRLAADPVDHAFYLSAYEASRARSPFNRRLYARRNHPGELRMLTGHVRHSKTSGRLESRELSRDEICEALKDDIGLSDSLIGEWVRSGALEACFEPAGATPAFPDVGKPPSQRGLAPG